jgi:U3 small nucleolar RNA-associated protein 22
VNTSGLDQNILSVDHSNVKQLIKKQSSTKKTTTDKTINGTPYYNHGILEDSYFKTHLQLLHEQLKDCSALVEAITLLKVWSRQRGIYYSYDGVNGFLMSILVYYLLKKNVITKHQSSFQMMKHLMQWIVKNDISKSGVSLNTTTTAKSAVTKKYHSLFDCVLLDDSDKFNIFYRVSKSAWHELQQEAQLTLQYFEDDSKVEAIQALFLTKHNIWHKYDRHIIIQNIDSAKVNNTAEQSQNIQLRNHIHTILDRSLQQRIQYLRILNYESIVQSGLNKKVNDNNNNNNTTVSNCLIIGIMLSKEYNDPITIGPPPSDKQLVSQFQEFWGDKVEMKRLGSGKTAMVVEWQQSDDVIEQVCKYIINLHVKGLNKMDVNLLRITEEEEKQSGHHSLNDAFNTLKDILMYNVEHGTNLRVKGVNMVGPHGLNLNVNTNSEEESGTIIVPTMLEFFDNSKWPDSIKAIQQLKQLLYIRLHDVILATASENSYRIVVNKNWVDIVTVSDKSEQYCFRLVIFVSKEIQVYKSTGNAMEQKLIEMERTFVHGPLHYQYMSIFTSSYPVFASTVRMAKRWIHAHLLSDYIPEQLVELLVAYVFASPYPYQVPHTVACGFIRFIHLLKSFNWSDQVLTVQFDENTTSQKQTIATAAPATTNRPAMCIVTSYNNQISAFCREPMLNPMIVNRLVNCAKATEQLIIDPLSSVGISSNHHQPEIMKPNLAVFDIIVQIKKQQQELLDLIGFDPISMYVNDLRVRLNKFGLIFRDATAGDVIAIVWNPSSFVPTTFQMNQSSAMCPLHNGTMVLPNIIELLNDIKQLGQGLISKIELK